jgi:two-component sensor histidine kinase
VIRRLSEFDIPKLLAGVAPRWVAELSAALVFVAAASVLRIGIDLVVPGVVPFILLFPAILCATLLAGWRAGAETIALGSAAVWRFLLTPDDAGETLPAVVSVLLFYVSGGVLVWFASAYRASANAVAEEGRRRLEERELLLKEFNHRAKNDFQTLSGLLQLQLRKTEEPSAMAALTAAIERVQGVAQVHASLYASGEQASMVDIRDYLTRLCEGLAANHRAGAGVRLTWSLASQPAQRDRAAVLGLIVNELVTNAIKHAFADGIGSIHVSYERVGEGGRLVVADDGVGLPTDYRSSGGVGRRLVEALARQVDGTLSWSSDGGARFQLDLASPET